MSREVVELDFFNMEKEKQPRSTIKDIQSVISKINPQLIRHAIESAGAPRMSIPVLLQSSRFDSESSLPGTAPLTMFYNGKVMVYDLPNDKAESIMRMAGDAAAFECVTTSTANSMLGDFCGELPMTRKKSLQRFLAKRKARLTSSHPYKRELESYSIKRE
ncbi:hypothetical protein LUZ63_005429 [Rhynchospora breviuscula]|uniref:Protein TIFY n=1 Tax=Rhynchospora breviuscula TaxID=2022672 RepID=A0A9Q0CMV1_9POAL|nr:hypothetical protein LUZ63_005429 [Rhynchospora breviuscula]